MNTPPRRAPGARFVGSPISPDEAEQFSNDEWLAAMRRYDYGRLERHENLARSLEGSAAELSRVLNTLAQRDRLRFAALVHRMEDSIRPEYFDAILEGICGRGSSAAADRELEEEAFCRVPTETVLEAIRRLHRLPGRLCGKSICWAFQRIAGRELSTSDLEILRHYALDDTDPDGDGWYDLSPDTSDLDRAAEQVFFRGYNSTRGLAAMAIEAIMFASATHVEFLLPILERMAGDRSAAVRSCVMHALLPLLNHDRNRAVGLFLSACGDEPILVGADPFEGFVQYAAGTHYASLRPTLQAALNSPCGRAVTAAARQTCLEADLSGGVL